MKKYLIVLAAALVALAGCKNNGGGNEYTNIRFKNATLEILVGSTDNLQVLYEPTTIEKAPVCEWSSSDTTIVTVDQNGNIEVLSFASRPSKNSVVKGVIADQKVDVARHAPAHRPERQQIVGTVVRPVAAQNLLELRCPERLELQASRVASAQRLGIRKEYLLHEAVHATADDEVELRAGVVLVPNALYGSENAGIHPVEFLELVQNDGHGVAKRHLHDGLEQLRKAGCLPNDYGAQSLLHLILEIEAERPLWLSGDGEVQIGGASVVQRLSDQFRLANAPATGKHDELRNRLRLIPEVPEDSDFPFSSKEVHECNPSFR